MELTFREMIEDTLDGTKGWRDMPTKELAFILEERIEGWFNVVENLDELLEESIEDEQS